MNNAKKVLALIWEARFLAAWVSSDDSLACSLYRSCYLLLCVTSPWGEEPEQWRAARASISPDVNLGGWGRRSGPGRDPPTSGSCTFLWLPGPSSGAMSETDR